MNRSAAVLGGGIVLSVLIAALALFRGSRIQERLDRVERENRDLRKAPVASGSAVAAPPSRLEERVAALESALAGRAAAPPATGAHAPAPATPEFKEAARSVYSRMREEEQADLVVGNWDASMWPMIVEFIRLDESQAAAARAVFDEEGGRLKAFYNEARSEEGAVLARIRARDAEIRKEAYARIRPFLQPSQYLALKVWAGWECDPRERDVLERWDWKNLDMNFKFLAPYRPTIEEALRQLHDVSDRNHANPPRAGELVAAKERELAAAVVDTLAPRLTDLESRALRLHFGLPVPPLLPPEPAPAPAPK